MSEETNIQCPACTAELTSGTIECPWCGHMMTPRIEQVLMEELTKQEEENSEPALAELPEEPASEPPLPEEPVFAVAEPGLTELPVLPGRTSPGNLKVMGIVLTVFSFLALLFFAFQVFQDKLPPLVLVVPIFGMMIGLISIAVGQKR